LNIIFNDKIILISHNESLLHATVENDVIINCIVKNIRMSKHYPIYVCFLHSLKLVLSHDGSISTVPVRLSAMGRRSVG